MSEASAITVSDLKPKTQLTGTVKRIELAGAIIDIGAEKDALLHISQIKGNRIKNVGDALEQGQQIDVWVLEVDEKTGTVVVTMHEPPDVTWDELAVGQVRNGTVVRLEKFGAFVDIGAQRPGLVHISELATGFVEKASDVVAKGDEVEVRIIGLNRRKNQIDLSMKAMEEDPTQYLEEEEQEELPTAMALALQRAMQGEMAEDDQGSASSGGKKKSSRGNAQAEIIRRSLERLSDGK